MSKQKSHQSSRKAATTRSRVNSTPRTVATVDTAAVNAEGDTTAQTTGRSAVVAEAPTKENVAVTSKPAVAEAPAKEKAAVTSKPPVAVKAASTPTNTGAKTAVAGNKPRTKDSLKYERRQMERQQRMLAERRAKRKRTITIFSIILAVVVIGGGLATYIIYNNTHATPPSSTSASAFQEPIYNSDYQPVDNVYCDQGEGDVMHIHAHLTMYINGAKSLLPALVGIPTDASSGSTVCFYWLHTHDQTGVVHIEAPVNETFELGQFLDVWDHQFQSLGFPSELLLNTGWKIWLDGKVYNGNLASVPLNAHQLVTIAYNSPDVKPDTSYNWGTL